MTPLFLAGIVLLLSGLVGVLVSARRRTRDGYEDELGFHYGPEPRNR